MCADALLRKIREVESELARVPAELDRQIKPFDGATLLSTAASCLADAKPRGSAERARRARVAHAAGGTPTAAP